MPSIERGRTALAALVALAFALSTLAIAGDDLDLSALPRLPGSKDLYVGPASIIFTTAAPVDEAGEAMATLLSAQGWQAYAAAFASEANVPGMKILNLKKGAQALNVFITAAPAQGNVTNITYSALRIVHDLPFPSDASDIKFDASRPYLSCTTGSSTAATLDFFRTELASRGWTPWSLQTHAAVDRSDETTEHGAHAYYMSEAGKGLSLALRRDAGGKVAVTLEPIPASVLRGDAKQAATSEPAPSPPNVSKAPPTPARDAIDALAGDIMREATKAVEQALKGTTQPRTAGKHDAVAEGKPLAALPGNLAPIPLPLTAHDVEYDGADGRLEFVSGSTVSQVAHFYRSVMGPLGWQPRPSVIEKDNMSVLSFEKGEADVTITVMRMGDMVRVAATGTGLAAAIAPESVQLEPAPSQTPPMTVEDLKAEDAGGLPVPTLHTSRGTEKTLFRVTATADVPAPLDVVLAFYRRELAERGWKEISDRTRPGTEKSELQFDAAEGPAKLLLSRRSGATSVELTLRRKQQAMESGLMPKPGQTKLLIGNLTEKDATLVIAKRTIRVVAGAGANQPDGPTLEIGPGKHTYALKGAGRGAAPESFEAGPDEIWALMIGPGGVLALQMY